MEPQVAQVIRRRRPSGRVRPGTRAAPTVRTPAIENASTRWKKWSHGMCEIASVSLVWQRICNSPYLYWNFHYLVERQGVRRPKCFKMLPFSFMNLCLTTTETTEGKDVETFPNLRFWRCSGFIRAEFSNLSSSTNLEIVTVVQISCFREFIYIS